MNYRSQVINARFGDLFEFNSQNREYILSTLSVPAIKADFIENDNDFAFAKQLLISECKKMKSDEPNVEVMENSETNSNKFLVSFASRRAIRTNSIDSVIESDVTKYLGESDTSYDVVNKYPLIREIFYQHNTTLSSSAAVERVFSHSLLIFTPRRNRFSDDNFEKTIFLKLNRNKLKNKA